MLPMVYFRQNWKVQFAVSTLILLILFCFNIFINMKYVPSTDRDYLVVVNKLGHSYFLPSGYLQDIEKIKDISLISPIVPYQIYQNMELINLIAVDLESYLDILDVDYTKTDDNDVFSGVYISSDLFDVNKEKFEIDISPITRKNKDIVELNVKGRINKVDGDKCHKCILIDIETMNQFSNNSINLVSAFFIKPVSGSLKEVATEVDNLFKHYAHSTSTMKPDQLEKYNTQLYVSISESIGRVIYIILIILSFTVALYYRFLLDRLKDFNAYVLMLSLRTKQVMMESNKLLWIVLCLNILPFILFTFSAYSYLKNAGSAFTPLFQVTNSTYILSLVFIICSLFCHLLVLAKLNLKKGGVL